MKIRRKSPIRVNFNRINHAPIFFVMLAQKENRSYFLKTSTSISFDQIMHLHCKSTINENIRPSAKGQYVVANNTCPVRLMN